MLRACIVCKDEYYGDSWGIHFTTKMIDDPDWTEFTNKIIMCYYCYYGAKERQYEPEWEISK